MEKSVKIILACIIFLLIAIIGFSLFTYFKYSENKMDGVSLNTGKICLDLGCNAKTNFVGSINSNKYYSCGCRYAKLIKPENLNCFESEEEAVSEGYNKVDC